MGIQVNQNVQSLMVQYNLRRTSAGMAQALERLASGRRVNRASDDAVGMSISKNLQNQIRSFQQNIRGVNNGISIVSTAEANLGLITTSLDRIRELAVQAASDTMPDQQRALIQVEVEQLIEEINHLAGTTNFNGKNLLDGSFVDGRVMTGSSSGQFIVFSIADFRANVLGARAEVTGASGVDLNPILLGDLQLNGVEIPATTGDGVSTVNASASAIAKAAAINSRGGLTHIRAEAQPTVHAAAGAAIGDVTLDALNTLTINGVTLDNLVVSAADGGMSLVTGINAYSNQTGVVASLGAGGELTLTAEDGRNIAIDTTGGIAGLLGLQVGPGDFNGVATGQIRLTSTETISVTGARASIGLTGVGQATTGLDYTTALDTVDVTTADGARRTQGIIDLAHDVVLNVRTQLGAVQNRLESSVEMLRATVEQLSASDSRIIDADFAVETAELIRTQILQEAGLAILAQANAVPRMALDLLTR